MTGVTDAPVHVQLEAVERTFGDGERATRVLSRLDLTVRVGERVALYGPSGSGKTTLLNLIGALDRPTSGRIRLCGQDIVKMNEQQRANLRRTQIGFVFQSHTLIPTYSAIENVELALRLSGFGFLERGRLARAALESVGLMAWSEHLPDELSGGQRQRVAVARALASKPPLVLADEPTSGLDTGTARRVLTLFERVALTQHTTFVIVSHDPMVASYVDTAYDLHDGQLFLRPSTEKERQ